MYSSSKVESCCDEPGTCDQRYHIDNTLIANVRIPLFMLLNHLLQRYSHVWQRLLNMLMSRLYLLVIQIQGHQIRKWCLVSFRMSIHISGRLMDDFLELARENTEKDLETCGVLGAFLEKGTYYVTTLIIPKQEATSNSCEALKEEELFAIQNERSLFPLGWIHTHPSQSCFMSSVDLHTHYSYQAMIPEAIAIVMAPTDSSRSYGIFRLSSPVGMSVLKECKERISWTP